MPSAPLERSPAAAGLLAAATVVALSALVLPAAARAQAPAARPVFFAPWTVPAALQGDEQLLRDSLSAHMLGTGRFAEAVSAETGEAVRECIRRVNTDSNAETCWIRLGQGQGAQLLVTGAIDGDQKSCALTLRLTELETRVSPSKHVGLVTPCERGALLAEVRRAAAVLTGTGASHLDGAGASHLDGAGAGARHLDAAPATNPAANVPRYSPQAMVPQALPQAVSPGRSSAAAAAKPAPHRKVFGRVFPVLDSRGASSARTAAEGPSVTLWEDSHFRGVHATLTANGRLPRSVYGEASAVRSRGRGWVVLYSGKSMDGSTLAIRCGVEVPALKRIPKVNVGMRSLATIETDWNDEAKSIQLWPDQPDPPCWESSRCTVVDRPGHGYRRRGGRISEFSF